MTSSDERKKSNREKVRAHRARLRAQGLKPIQIWVPDVNSPEFIAEVHRQSKMLAESPHAKEDQDFVDSISWFNSPEADEYFETYNPLVHSDEKADKK